MQAVLPGYAIVIFPNASFLALKLPERTQALKTGLERSGMVA